MAQLAISLLLKSSVRWTASEGNPSLGTVKWFNAWNDYRFISKDDSKADIFLHWEAIKRNNLKKLLCSSGDEETLYTDVLKG